MHSAYVAENWLVASWGGTYPQAGACDYVALTPSEFEQLQVLFANQTPPSPTQLELIPALSVLFGAILAAAAVVWGFKRVYAVLMSGGGRDD